MFSRLERERFIEKMVAYVRSNSCSQAGKVPEKELARDIDHLVDKAMSYGYSKQQDIYYFIELVLMCGDDFENNPKYSSLVSNLRRNNGNGLLSIKRLYNSIKKSR